LFHVSDFMEIINAIAINKFFTGLVAFVGRRGQ